MPRQVRADVEKPLAEKLERAIQLLKLWAHQKSYVSCSRVKEKGRKVDDGSKDSNICCYHLKEKPILKLTREMGLTHCFTGLTAMESRKRAWMACQKGDEYYVKKQFITKIHPILYWQPQEVHQFIKDLGIPVNPVYEKYRIPRTGCQCCTCYMGWKEQLARINPKLYKIIQERYFGQCLIDSSAWRKPDDE